MAALSDKKTKDQQLKWYRIGYGAFVLLSFYFLLVSRDMGSFVSNLGIALIFDPFDQKVTWSKRPLWQRVWLLAHVSLVLAGFGFMIFGK